MLRFFRRLFMARPWTFPAWPAAEMVAGTLLQLPQGHQLLLCELLLA
jgi:hypothetical protein